MDNETCNISKYARKTHLTLVACLTLVAARSAVARSKFDTGEIGCLASIASANVSSATKWQSNKVLAAFLWAEENVKEVG